MRNVERLCLAHFWVAFGAFLIAAFLGTWQMWVRSPLGANVGTPGQYFISVTAHGVSMAYVMTTFFTEAKGIVSAVARSARRSSRRFPGLEPMHLLRVGLEERADADVASLLESSIVRPRLGVVASLERLDAAGRALRWVRKASPPGTPEPAVWREINALLDVLDAAGRGCWRARSRSRSVSG